MHLFFTIAFFIAAIYDYIYKEIPLLLVIITTMVARPKMIYVLLITILFRFFEKEEYIGLADILFFFLSFEFVNIFPFIIYSTISAHFYGFFFNKKKIAFIPFLFISYLLSQNTYDIYITF